MKPIFNNVKGSGVEGRVYLLCTAQCIELGQSNEIYPSM